MQIEKAKSYIKPLLYVVGSLIILYVFINIFTKKDHIPAQLQTTIDSLNKVNAVLIQHQKQVDSTLQVYNAQIKQVDLRVQAIKEKITIVREYYHEQSQTAKSYTPTQVDSFLRRRYSY